jgi:hypothetical protein
MGLLQETILLNPKKQEKMGGLITRSFSGNINGNYFIFP